MSFGLAPGYEIATLTDGNAIGGRILRLICVNATPPTSSRTAKKSVTVTGLRSENWVRNTAAILSRTSGERLRSGWSNYFKQEQLDASAAFGSRTSEYIMSA